MGLLLVRAYINLVVKYELPYLVGKLCTLPPAIPAARLLLCAFFLNRFSGSTFQYNEGWTVRIVNIGLV